VVIQLDTEVEQSMVFAITRQESALNPNRSFAGECLWADAGKRFTLKRSRHVNLSEAPPRGLISRKEKPPAVACRRFF
jgi:hypothetical protein